MSIELDVRLSGLFEVDDLLQRSHQHLSAVLNCSDVPALKGQELRSGVLTPVVPGQKLFPGRLLLISTDEPECSSVSVVITEVTAVCGIADEDDESGLWAGVRVETRVPAAFALAVGVAVAAAAGGEILDESRFWYRARKVAAPHLAGVLTIPSGATNFLLAAESFYKRLPKGHF